MSSPQRSLVTAVILLTSTIGSLLPRDTHAEDKDWSIEASILWLQHEGQGTAPIVQQFSGAPGLTSDDFDMAYDPTWELSGSIALSESVGLTGRYTEAYWTSEISKTLPVPDASPNAYVATQIPSVPTGPISVINAYYDSELQSAEIMLTATAIDGPDLTVNVNAGFRWVSLDERSFSGLALSGGAFPAFIGVDQKVDNDLYGFQIGFDALYEITNSYAFDVWGNIGVLANHANVSVHATPFQRPTTVDDFASNSATDAALLGELGFGFVWRTSDALRFRAGYRLMWLDGVAMATDQLSKTSQFSPVTSTTVAVDTGTLLVHGADLAVIISF